MSGAAIGEAIARALVVMEDRQRCAGEERSYVIEAEDEIFRAVEEDLDRREGAASGTHDLCAGTGLRRVRLDGVWTCLLCSCASTEEWSVNGDPMTVRYADLVRRPMRQEAPPERYEREVDVSEQRSLGLAIVSGGQDVETF